MRVYPNSYTIDGKRYDRVTSVLNYLSPKPLVDWALDKGKEGYKSETKVAKAIGTRVDKIAQAILEKRHWCITENDYPAIRNCVTAFQNWLKEEQPNIVSWQNTYRDDILKVAGTDDFETEDTVIDLKCANSIRLSYWVQVATYIKSSGKNNLKFMAILRLDKLTADYEFVRYPYDERLYNLFVGLLNYYRYITMFDKKTEKKGENSKVITEVQTEFDKKFGLFAPVKSDNWTKFHKEI